VSADTPMLKQYWSIKRQHRDKILLFRLGDFYETFFDDAEVTARALEITLTAREAKGKKYPMAGFPCHAADTYIARLVNKGYKVAICEQVEDPRQASGLVEREVVRIVTPGTLTDPEMLEEKEYNFLAAITFQQSRGRYGLAYADVSTGTFMMTEFEDAKSLLDEVLKVAPRECLLDQAIAEDEALRATLREIKALVTSRPPWEFSAENAETVLMDHFGTTSLRAYGYPEKICGLRAAAAIIGYLRETQRASLAHMRKLSSYDSGHTMYIDRTTLRNLELLGRGLRDRKGTLIHTLDRTLTAMGGRTLRSWVERPLLDVEQIERRLAAVGELRDNSLLRARLRDLLKKLYDLERLTSRVANGTANARDLVALGQSLEVLPQILKTLAEARSERLVALAEEIDPLSAVAELIKRALVDNPPTTLREGGLIREGYDREVDELRSAAAHGRDWIVQLESSERERTGIRSLKVGYNKVFGYYIEVTNSYKHLVPAEYIRKQTLTNSERYITPELKAYEEKILGAQERLEELEYEIFLRVREEVAGEADRILRTASALGQLDALASLAEVALRNSYVKPRVHTGDVIRIVGGRHPVLEEMMGRQRFVPNDTFLDRGEEQVLIITGPNMAGKSTYLRQVALIVIMAQMGSFVPAEEAEIGLVDRVFTRVGASDDISRGESTFFREMLETADILNNATARSLVLLDEIGRGTSTFDGLSLAWAVSEYIHDRTAVGARTLFATHYHELTALEKNLPRVKNYCVAVEERGSDVIFLHKIVRGASDRSYGIHVAKLAGIPYEVIARAAQILATLEEREGGGRVTETAASREPTQLSFLVESDSHPVLEELKELDVLNMTPIEALNKLYELQQLARKGGGEEQ